MEDNSMSIDVKKIIDDTILEKINTALDQIDIRQMVTDIVEERINNGKFQKYLSDQINAHVDSVPFKTVALQRLDKVSNNILNSQVNGVIEKVRERVDGVLAQTVEQKVRSVDFPNHTIGHNKIDWQGYTLTSDKVVGPLNTKGIQDLSDQVQLTILQDTVVIENELQVPNVNASVVSADSLTVSGENISADSIKQQVLQNIPTPTNYDNAIEYLQKHVQELQDQKNYIRDLEVSGESILSETLYTAQGTRRVGINTQDPTDALTVWDSEVETVIGKHKGQEAYFGTRRRQKLNIGANNKIGITIDNGEVNIKKLSIDSRTIGSSASVPGHIGKRGDIVLNINPRLGDPIGWVCLENTQWGKFGIIS